MKTRMILTMLAIVTISLGTMAGTGTLNIDTENSSVEWAAKKMGGAHNGLVSISEGSLEFEDGNLTGGSFVIDMASISVTDIENEKYNAKLVGHLNSPDFFGIDTYPTASLEITGSEKDGDNYVVKGNITIKETTKPIEFSATMGEADGKKTATAEVQIDRTEFDVRYGSKKFFDNLGDKFISDYFNLTINLVGE